MRLGQRCRFVIDRQQDRSLLWEKKRPERWKIQPAVRKLIDEAMEH
jgi:hypothetical protein